MNASPQIPSFSFKGLRELRKRLFFALIALVCYRVGLHIPLPGIDLEALAALNQSSNSGVISHFNMVSGGALSRSTICALGLLPYISCSLIMQLLLGVLPTLEKLREEGEAGQRQLKQYTRYGTFGLAIFQSFGMTQLLTHYYRVVSEPNFLFYSVAMLSLVAGSMFLMWLSDQMTDSGLGNGTSLIVFAGIVANIPTTSFQFIEQARQGQISTLSSLLTAIVLVSAVAFVVFMERAQRKIKVNYPNRQQGRNSYTAQSSHLPLKINMAGISPAIYTSYLMMLPNFLVEVLAWFGITDKYVLLQRFKWAFVAGQPLYIIVSALLLTFFCFFYIAVNVDINPRKMAETLKKSGAFIPGIRPGEQSAQYIDKVVTRLTVIGATYLVLMMLLPDWIALSQKLSFAFGGSALLIVIMVVMEFIAQIQSLLISHQYESLLKKSGLKINMPTR